MIRRVVLLLLIISFSLFGAVSAAKKSDFKTCGDSGFCSRYRFRADDVGVFYVDPNSLEVRYDGVSGLVYSPQDSPFPFSIDVLAGGTVHLKVVEENPLHARYEVSEIIEPVEHDLVVPGEITKSSMRLSFSDGECFLVLSFSPFAVDVSCRGTTLFEVNGQGMMHFEKLAEAAPVEKSGPQNKDEDGPPELESFEEKFGTHRDSRPRGPESIGLDVSFKSGKHVYGIPEHATNFALKPTKKANSNEAISEPYRLFNLDVFEYEVDSPMALYASVPFMVSHGPKVTTGMLWLNAAETWVDVEKREKESIGVSTHWMSESGVVDVYLFTGDSTESVFDRYTELTGRVQLPQLFATMYHQCRWNYKSQEDVLMVNRKFDELDIPMDVIWLDIEHTNGKKYFTWDSAAFPDSLEMQDTVLGSGRKMVTIVDPHIKKDSSYSVYQEALDSNYFVKNKDGDVFEGHCWPGQSSYLDFVNPDVRGWFADLYDPSNYKGIRSTTYTWNDMQEPSVFTGPEITMSRDAVHSNGIEHRSLHNQYCYFMGLSTFEGHLRRTERNGRPFILSRAVFAGSQRYGAVWTGDNTAEWKHLAMSGPMLLSLGVAGQVFAGADVGGFFGNPDKELFIRWNQAAAFQPFFRGHSHIDTQRREPWCFDDETTSIVREAIRSRYRLLPYWYTMFYKASVNGMPVMRPLWVEFPSDMEVWEMDDQWLVGNALLVHPVVGNEQRSVSVYFPEGRWYSLTEPSVVITGPGTENASAPLDFIPSFQRGGTILPMKMRIRRSASLMIHDPITLRVALSDDGSASGELYMDDGKSFDYLKGSFVHVSLAYASGELTATLVNGTLDSPSWVERVHVFGITNAPKSVVVSGETVQGPIEMKELEFEFNEKEHALTIRNPGVLCTKNFRISLQ